MSSKINHNCTDRKKELGSTSVYGYMHTCVCVFERESELVMELALST